MMQEFNRLLEHIDSYIGGHWWFVWLLLLTGFFFTLYLGFPQLRYFKHAFNIVRGKYDKKGATGDTSHFQALTTALSGTVGTGNIAGVALAIHLGGPAAMFWMIITAFLGMTTKFVEVTLSHKYREKDSKGLIAGGPMYYMRNKLAKRPGIQGKFFAGLGIFFAIATVISSIGSGNMPQSTSIADSVKATFGLENWITGAFLSVFLGLVIIGGIKRIAKVTERLVPFMAVVYLVGAVAVLITNYHNIGWAFTSIFSDVFNGTAAVGGFLGAGFSFAFNRGVNRGLFSNEAGQGSAPIAHASARAEEPVSEGMVAILEPFIDTILICTLTGVVLLSSGVWQEKFENDFQLTDMQILQGQYQDGNEADAQTLYGHLSGGDKVAVFNGSLTIQDGVIQDDVTVVHARSIAEDVRVMEGDELYTGEVTVKKGLVGVLGPVTFRGKSLIHSAPLTAEAFTRGLFGEWGKYIISIGLVLFAFSTALSWSYYGGRAMTFLLGSGSVLYYRIVYVLGFFMASVADTTLIWTIALITVPMMTVPNLIGILSLHRDMRSTVRSYWQDFNREHKK